MLKQSILFIFLALSFTVKGQIQVLKIIGKNSKDFKLGFGAYLKFGYPVSDAADITLEGGANYFQLKNTPQYGWAMIPIKAGYRYTLNQTGKGFYLEPQLGYNVFGIDPADNKFTGLVLAGGAGYIFNPGIIQFDLGLLFESVQHKGGAANYLSLRLSHNFQFKKRDSDE